MKNANKLHKSKKEEYILPVDIEKKRKNKRIRTIIFSLVWYVCLLAAFLYAQKRVLEFDASSIHPSRADMSGAMNTVFSTIFILAYFYFPFITFRPQRLFFERNWTGVILNKESPKASGDTFDPSTKIILTVKINNTEKIVIVKYKFKDEKIDAAKLYYNIGDEIHHYKWVRYCKKTRNIVNNGIHKSQRFCIVCGWLNDIDMKYCKECRSSIVE